MFKEKTLSDRIVESIERAEKRKSDAEHLKMLWAKLEKQLIIEGNHK